MIAILGMALALASAPADAGKLGSGLRSAKPDTVRAVATKATRSAATAKKAVSDSTPPSVRTDSAKAPDPSRIGAKTDSTMPAVSTAASESVATAAVAGRDTSETHHLPPRTLPLKRQMMFAGGFMVFIALMMTSLQNFNPND